MEALLFTRARLNLWLGLFAAVALSPLAPCIGQQGKGSSSSQKSSAQTTEGGSGSNSGQSTGSAGGFSMEAEILAYQSLQSDSEAIACDVATYLFPNYTIPAMPNQLSSSAVTSPCRFGNPLSNTKPAYSATGVVILLSSDAGLANLQQWRASMAIMKGFELEAQPYCQEKKDGSEKAVLPTDVLTAADQAVTVVKDIAGLFALNQSISGVQGTIQDQALGNGVARQLKAIGIPVLVPAIYSPYSIGGLDPADSPFLANYEKIIRLRVCLQAQMRSAATTADRATIDSVKAQLKALNDELSADSKLPPSEQAKKQDEIAKARAQRSTLAQQLQELNARDKSNEIAAIISGIDAFVAAINGTPSGKSTTGSGSQDNSASTGTVPASDVKSAAPAAVGSATVPPIVSILAADGLAKKLGATLDGNFATASTWHILSLKALESGGEILTQSNLFGSKISFSGGAIATYALFSIDGTLSCSGNVFDYGGYLRAKDFTGKFHKPTVDPSQQLVFFRGRCSVP